MTIFRGTKDAQLFPFALEIVRNGYKFSFTLNVIDTPGLFEIVKPGEEQRDNALLVDAIKACMDRKIVKVHGIFFVFAAGNGITREDVRSMMTFADFFKGAGAWISLVVSNADEWSPEVCANLVRQFKEEKELQPLLQMISEKPVYTEEAADPLAGPTIQQTTESEPRIFFSCCVARETVQIGDSVQLQNRLEKVREYRQNFLHHIWRSKAEFDLRNLQMAWIEEKDAKDKVKELHHLNIQCVKALFNEQLDVATDLQAQIKKIVPLVQAKLAFLHPADKAEAREALNKAQEILPG